MNSRGYYWDHSHSGGGEKWWLVRGTSHANPKHQIVSRYFKWVNYDNSARYTICYGSQWDSGNERWAESGVRLTRLEVAFQFARSRSCLPDGLLVWVCLQVGCSQFQWIIKLCNYSPIKTTMWGYTPFSDKPMSAFALKNNLLELWLAAMAIRGSWTRVWSSECPRVESSQMFSLSSSLQTCPSSSHALVKAGSLDEIHWSPPSVFIRNLLKSSTDEFVLKISILLRFAACAGVSANRGLLIRRLRL